MKITLLLVLLNWSPSNVSMTATTTSTAQMSTTGTTYSTPLRSPSPTVVRVPMPDLKSCLDARHQIDGYSMLVAAACSAE